YKNNKDFIILAIIASCMANTHYFLIIILFNIFIYSLFVLDNKSKLKFFLVNLFAALTFLPYFLLTSLNQALLNEGFNVMPVFKPLWLWYTVQSYFSNSIIPVFAIILFVLLLIPKIKNKLIKDNTALHLFIFSVFTVFSLFITAQIFSIYIRPVLRIYYPVIVTAFLSVIVSSVFFLSYKNKFIKLFIFLVFLFNGIFCVSGVGMYLNKDSHLVLRMEEIIKFLLHDSNQYINEGKDISLVVIDFSEYLKYYKFPEKITKEQVVCKTNDSFSGLYRNLIQTDTDITYIMLASNSNMLNFVNYFKIGYNISSVKTDKGVILARMTRL
ncbi:MAG: hypothetical protein LUE64_02125, partial [Candidatus Gastranaerophilales bacterium]|nr:hypothetical protein [Candidatus Gastranaerophilales bacterium]